jgi:hypothetical protein
MRLPNALEALSDRGLDVLRRLIGSTNCLIDNVSGFLNIKPLNKSKGCAGVQRVFVIKLRLDAPAGPAWIDDWLGG